MQVLTIQIRVEIDPADLVVVLTRTDSESLADLGDDVLGMACDWAVDRLAVSRAIPVSVETYSVDC